MPHARTGDAIANFCTRARQAQALRSIGRSIRAGDMRSIPPNVADDLDIVAGYLDRFDKESARVAYRALLMAHQTAPGCRHLGAILADISPSLALLANSNVV